MIASQSSRLKIFQSMWGFTGSWDEAVRRAYESNFNGLEVNLNHGSIANLDVDRIISTLNSRNLSLIVELTSGGGYVPDLDNNPEQHLEEIATQLSKARALTPQKITLITGSDSWDESVQNKFLEKLLDIIDSSELAVSIETHRSRSLFNPWAIVDRLSRHPRLRLTADLSHWCAVSERLMTPDLEPIKVMAERVDHIHARVGHAQGPSVSHPFAPEWSEALEAHRRCWQLFLNKNTCAGRLNTITPEFGPDGYMPIQPFTANPLADIQILNSEMASWLRSALVTPEESKSSR